MQNYMKAFVLEGEWAPKPDYIFSSRELKDKRAMRADLVYKNISAELKVFLYLRLAMMMFL